MIASTNRRHAEGGEGIAVPSNAHLVEWLSYARTMPRCAAVCTPGTGHSPAPSRAACRWWPARTRATWPRTRPGSAGPAWACRCRAASRPPAGSAWRSAASSATPRTPTSAGDPGVVELQRRRSRGDRALEALVAEPLAAPDDVSRPLPSPILETCVREQVCPERRSRPVAARAAGRGWGSPAGDGRGNGPLDRNYQILAFPLGCRPDRSAPTARLRPSLGAERGDQGVSSTWEHAVRPRGPPGSYRCKQCRLEQVSRWRRRVKAKLVAEAGGRCVLCGYDRCLAALQFHHLDRATKSFSSRDGIARIG